MNKFDKLEIIGSNSIQGFALSYRNHKLTVKLIGGESKTIKCVAKETKATIDAEFFTTSFWDENFENRIFSIAITKEGMLHFVYGEVEKTIYLSNISGKITSGLFSGIREY